MFLTFECINVTSLDWNVRYIVWVHMIWGARLFYFIHNSLYGCLNIYVSGSRIVPKSLYILTVHNIHFNKNKSEHVYSNYCCYNLKKRTFLQLQNCFFCFLLVFGLIQEIYNLYRYSCNNLQTKLLSIDKKNYELDQKTHRPPRLQTFDY